MAKNVAKGNGDVSPADIPQAVRNALVNQAADTKAVQREKANPRPKVARPQPDMDDLYGGGGPPGSGDSGGAGGGGGGGGDGDDSVGPPVGGSVPPTPADDWGDVGDVIKNGTWDHVVDGPYEGELSEGEVDDDLLIKFHVRRAIASRINKVAYTQELKHHDVGGYVDVGNQVRYMPDVNDGYCDVSDVPVPQKGTGRSEDSNNTNTTTTTTTPSGKPQRVSKPCSGIFQLIGAVQHPKKRIVVTLMCSLDYPQNWKQQKFDRTSYRACWFMRFQLLVEDSMFYGQLKRAGWHRVRLPVPLNTQWLNLHRLNLAGASMRWFKDRYIAIILARTASLEPEEVYNMQGDQFLLIDYKSLKGKFPNATPVRNYGELSSHAMGNWLDTSHDGRSMYGMVLGDAKPRGIRVFQADEYDLVSFNAFKIRGPLGFNYVFAEL